MQPKNKNIAVNILAYFELSEILDSCKFLEYEGVFGQKVNRK